MSTIAPAEYKLKNGKTLIVRTAQVKDASHLVKLMKGIVAEGPYTLVEPDEYKATVKSESAKIKRFAKAEGKIYVVGEIKNEITGFISFDNWDTRRTKHTGLFSVFIKKKFRKLGIGRILVQSLIDWGKSNPVNTKISLAVFSSNKNAISLYKKLGFKKEGYCPRDMIIAGKYVDSILMYKFTKINKAKKITLFLTA